MKARIAIFLCVALLLLSGCVSLDKHEREVTEARDAGYNDGYDDGYNDGKANALGIEDPVFITLTGDKYHQSDCSYLNDSNIIISRLSALERGYTPCSVCDP